MDHFIAKALCGLVALSAVVGPAFANEGKPVAILGGRWPATVVQQHVLLPSNIRYERLTEWLPPSQYGKYSVVYLAETLKSVKDMTRGSWLDSGAAAQVRDYVRSGGVIVMTGGVYHQLAAGRDLRGLADLIGFERSTRSPQPVAFRVLDKTDPVTAPLRKKSYGWHGWSLGVSGLKGARVLVGQVDKKGKVLSPFVTVMPMGKGKVYWFSGSLYRLSARLGSTGDADAMGRYELSEPEKDLEAYRGMIERAVLLAKPARGGLKREVWDPTPLGAKVPPQPEPTPPMLPMTPPPTPPRGDPILLADKGKACCTVLLHKGKSGHLAQVVQQTVSQMTGARIPVAMIRDPGQFEASPAGIQAKAARLKGQNFILIGPSSLHKGLGVDADSLPPECMIIKSVGNTIVLTGDVTKSRGLGPRHAIYAFLEQLGCRYLWPGDLGKVIPRRTTLRIPPLDLRQAPRMWSRAIRMSGPWRSSRYSRAFKRLGITPDEYRKVFEKAAKSSLKDHGWLAWHRFGSHRRVSRGHSFGGFWKRYGKDHPEWFALQSNGVRDQTLSISRPRLCHSNRELVAETIRDRTEYLKKNPKASSVAIGLNDGGYTGFCMCAACRKLDPSNGPRLTFTDCSRSPRRRYGYVSLTDRVLSFTNQVAEGVATFRPGTTMGFYAYSAYRFPPLKMKPHPSLVIFYVGTSLDDWKRWARHGNRMFLRPNVLLKNRRRLMPQNFGRKLFSNFRTMYRTGMIGTDFDSCQHNWALMGVVYYALAKAHWDATAVDYDALVADYCRAGFGPAADAVGRYLAHLEKVSDRAEHMKKPIVQVYTDADLAKLQDCLAAARNAAEGAEDTNVAKRIEFLQAGLDFGEVHLSYFRKPKDKTRQKAFSDALHRIANANPLVVNAPLVRMYVR